MKYIDVSVFGMVWWSQLCVGRASGFCGGSAPEGLPPRVLIDIVAVGCELACICCGGLLSAAGRAVFEKLSQCKHAVSRTGVYANVWRHTCGKPAGVLSPSDADCLQ